MTRLCHWYAYQILKRGSRTHGTALDAGRGHRHKSSLPDSWGYSASLHSMAWVARPCPHRSSRLIRAALLCAARPLRQAVRVRSRSCLRVFLLLRAGHKLGWRPKYCLKIWQTRRQVCFEYRQTSLAYLLAMPRLTAQSSASQG